VQHTVGVQQPGAPVNVSVNRAVHAGVGLAARSAAIPASLAPGVVVTPGAGGSWVPIVRVSAGHGYIGSSSSPAGGGCSVRTSAASGSSFVGSSLMVTAAPDDDGFPAEWSAEQAVHMYDEGEGHRFLGKAQLLDRRKVSGISAAIDGLNRRTIDLIEDFCMVYSSSLRSYYLLWRRNRKADAFAALGLSDQDVRNSLQQQQPRHSWGGTPSVSTSAERAALPRKSAPCQAVGGSSFSPGGRGPCLPTLPISSVAEEPPISPMSGAPLLSGRLLSPTTSSNASPVGAMPSTASTFSPARVISTTRVGESPLVPPTLQRSSGTASASRLSPACSVKTIQASSSTQGSGNVLLSGVSTGLSTLAPTAKSTSSTPSRDSFGSTSTLSPSDTRLHGPDDISSPLSTTTLPPGYTFQDDDVIDSGRVANLSALPLQAALLQASPRHCSSV